MKIKLSGDIITEGFGGDFDVESTFPLKKGETYVVGLLIFPDYVKVVDVFEQDNDFNNNRFLTPTNFLWGRPDGSLGKYQLPPGQMCHCTVRLVSFQ